jgi:urea transporter
VSAEGNVPQHAAAADELKDIAFPLVHATWLLVIIENIVFVRKDGLRMIPESHVTLATIHSTGPALV